MDEGHSSERHPIHVLIHDEEVGDIGAHSWMHVAPEGDDDAEGHGWKFEVGTARGADQVYVMRVHREDAAQSRGAFLHWFDPRDTEGEGVGGVLLHPAGPDDLQAQGFQAGVLKPDPSGSWTLHLDDTP